VTRLARVIRIIRTTRWSWRSPRRGAVLVFDSYASDPITQLLAPGSYDVFDNHFEVINVPIALRTLVTGGRSWYDYCRRFVAAARPRLLVSAIDSNAHLYTFKHVSPSTQIVVVQNGIRGTGAPVPSGDLWTTRSHCRQSTATVATGTSSSSRSTRGWITPTSSRGVDLRRH